MSEWTALWPILSTTRKTRPSEQGMSQIVQPDDRTMGDDSEESVLTKSVCGACADRERVGRSLSDARWCGYVMRVNAYVVYHSCSS